MRRAMAMVLVISIVLLQSGCSAFRSGTQRVSVVASEPDAKIYVNGAYSGAGTAMTRVPRNESLSVMATKDGYLPATRQIGTKMSFTGVLDIIGGCIILVPFFGLLFPGAHELDQTNISIALDKDTKPATK
ncbi:MAG: hypothetical protein PHS66_01380 [Candidatus Omnitrophica bacterium]|nr:hypothetical protein [Candidatus Omnitrophota bacterium]